MKQLRQRPRAIGAKLFRSVFKSHMRLRETSSRTHRTRKAPPKGNTLCVHVQEENSLPLPPPLPSYF
jgi:hypothetical protein